MNYLAGKTECTGSSSIQVTGDVAMRPSPLPSGIVMSQRALRVSLKNAGGGRESPNQDNDQQFESKAEM